MTLYNNSKYMTINSTEVELLIIRSQFFTKIMTSERKFARSCSLPKIDERAQNLRQGEAEEPKL